jgi:hypothetical protein
VVAAIGRDELIGAGDCGPDLVDMLDGWKLVPHDDLPSTEIARAMDPPYLLQRTARTGR